MHRAAGGIKRADAAAHGEAWHRSYGEARRAATGSAQIVVGGVTSPFRWQARSTSTPSARACRRRSRRPRRSATASPPASATPPSPSAPSPKRSRRRAPTMTPERPRRSGWRGGALERSRRAGACEAVRTRIRPRGRGHFDRAARHGHRHRRPRRDLAVDRDLLPRPGLDAQLACRAIRSPSARGGASLNRVANQLQARPQTLLPVTAWMTISPLSSSALSTSSTPPWCVPLAIRASVAQLLTTVPSSNVTLQPERAELDRHPRRPDQIAEHAEIVLERVRHRVGDQRATGPSPRHWRNSRRRCMPRSIRLRRPLAMTSIAPSRSSGMPSVRAKLLAVPSGSIANTVSVPTKWSTADDKRAVAAADDHHRRLGDRRLDDRLHDFRDPGPHGVDQLDPRRGQLVARLVERVGAAAAVRVDDQDRLFRQGALAT